MNARRVAKVQPSVDFSLFYLILQTSIKLGSYFQIKACVRLISWYAKIFVSVL